VELQATKQLVLPVAEVSPALQFWQVEILEAPIVVEYVPARHGAAMTEPLKSVPTLA
jgi:hypothetical protein